MGNIVNEAATLAKNAVIATGMGIAFISMLYGVIELAKTFSGKLRGSMTDDEWNMRVRIKDEEMKLAKFTIILFYSIIAAALVLFLLFRWR